MERLPRPDDSGELLPGFPLEMYSASSVADLLGSTEQVINDAVVRLDAWRQNLTPFKRRVINASTDYLKLESKLLGIKYMPVENASVLAHIPLVQHVPDRDTSPNPNVLTIFDVTGECVINIPSFLGRKFLEKTGWPLLSAEAYKSQSWRSDLILWANYNQRTQTNHYTLLHAENRHITEPEIARLFDGFRQLATQRIPF